MRLGKNMGSLGEGNAENGGLNSLIHTCHLWNGSAPPTENGYQALSITEKKEELSAFDAS